MPHDAFVTLRSLGALTAALSKQRLHLTEESN
jgi:hypothetical protein